MSRDDVGLKDLVGPEGLLWRMPRLLSPQVASNSDEPLVRVLVTLEDMLDLANDGEAFNVGNQDPRACKQIQKYS